MNNINTKEYWEKRFSRQEWNWRGRQQTEEYAKGNIKAMNISGEFSGKLLDYGCALGDAIPIYKNSFPEAKITGIDISEYAINNCIERYGELADFLVGEHNNIPLVDIIIASHIMEHLKNDKEIIREIIKRCRDLYVFVPFKESPLFFEHVNYYDIDSYNELNVKDYKIFSVMYKTKLPIFSHFKNALRFHFIPYINAYKEIIMFHFQGSL